MTTKQELDKDGTDGQMDMPEQMGKPMTPQPYTKDCRQLRKAESRRSFPQGRAQQLVTQYQIVSQENIHISNIKGIEQVIVTILYLYAYMH